MTLCCSQLHAAQAKQICCCNNSTFPSMDCAVGSGHDMQSFRHWFCKTLKFFSWTTVGLEIMRSKILLESINKQNKLKTTLSHKTRYGYSLMGFSPFLDYNRFVQQLSLTMCCCFASKTLYTVLLCVRYLLAWRKWQVSRFGENFNLGFFFQTLFEWDL